MRRREFIALIGDVVVRPKMAHAQQAGKRPRIGYLGVSSSSLEPHYVGAFRQKLRELGHVDGENLAIEYRWSGYIRTSL
jgi:putative ABC transport system substrate-binding protein